MRQFGELELSNAQEEFVDEQMFKWGAWVRAGRLNKSQVNIIAKLMQTVAPSEPCEAICDDDVGLMISGVVDRFFVKNDRTLRFIVFAYYVNKCTVNKIAVKLRQAQGEVAMQPCSGKSNIRVPSLDTMKRKVKRELKLAKSIIHELLITGFSLLRSGCKNAIKVKLVR